MRKWMTFGIIAMAFLFAASCGTISKDLRSQSVPFKSYKSLTEEAEKYTGKTVILGGYVIQIKKSGDKTVIEAEQAPLRFWDEPKSRRYSAGKLIISHEGLLEQDRLERDRKITVAGILNGCEGLTCRVESREIYIWPDYDFTPYEVYDYDPTYWYEEHHHGHYRSLDKIYQNLPEINRGNLGR